MSIPMKKYTFIDDEQWHQRFMEPNVDGGTQFYLASEADARILELEKYKHAVEEHNESCQVRCGVGDQEAVRCQYRPYFVNNGRRCPECPVHEKIVL
jgi:hypothetical protein